MMSANVLRGRQRATAFPKGFHSLTLGLAGGDHRLVIRLPGSAVTTFRALALVSSIGALAVIAVAVAFLTATSELVYSTRSGFACYHALPSCPPLPSGVSVFELNW